MSLFTYLLRLADDNLILAQRLGEWSARAPDLEEDIAITNLGLDLLGQARFLLDHAGAVEGKGQGEDQLAFLREERQFLNVLLVEQPNGDFAHTIARQLFFDAYQVPLWEGLLASTDRVLAGIAGKAIKEARYHLRHSWTWVVRLGDGTTESHQRMQAAVDDLWRFTGEFFWSDEVERMLGVDGVAVDPGSLRTPWEQTIEAVLGEATIRRPEDGHQQLGGRRGLHSEHLGHLLAEMQYMQRTYAGLQW